jgi:hypothetical protein
VPDIQVPEDLLSRLTTVAEHDYHGASMEETLDRLLREHQEYVMVEAAGELGRASEVKDQ